MKKPIRLNADPMDIQKLMDVLTDNPFIQPVKHMVEPVIRKIIPTLLEERSQLVDKANKRLEAMDGQSDDEVTKAKDAYNIKIISYLQKRTMELIVPEIMGCLLSISNTATPISLSKKYVEMMNELSRGEVSDDAIKAVGSLAASVATDTSERPNPQQAQFLKAQLKDSTSKVSNLIRGLLKGLAPEKLNPTTYFQDVEKVHETLTKIFTDELNKQCELLGMADNSENVEDSEDKFLEITLCLTDENSSTYNVITQAAELISARGHAMSQPGMHQLLTKIHLDVHQALEKDAPDCFEPKSPRSARNRFFCQWTKEEDVVIEGFEHGNGL